MLMYHAEGTGDRWEIYQGYRLVMVLDEEGCHRELLFRWNDRIKKGVPSESIEGRASGKGILSSTFHT